MTQFLKAVQSGVQKSPLFILAYGEPGTGKTTFGSQFPKPLVIDVEQGSVNLNIDRFVPKDYTEVKGVLEELILQPSPFETIIIDTLDRLESMIWTRVCAENGWMSIEDPGYGKGYNVALKKWDEFFNLLKRLRHSKNVIVIAHSSPKIVNDPTRLEAYERLELKLNKHAAALARESVDMVLYLAKEPILKITDKKGSKAKVVGEERVLYTKGGPGFEGKNRYAMPDRLPLSFNDFWNAFIQSSEGDPSKVIDQIMVLMPKIAPDKQKEILKFIETNKTNAKQLLIGLNRVTVLTQQEQVEEK